MTNDERYFRVVANLGLLYHAMGRFQKANEFTREALTLRQLYLGDQHNATAVSHNNLGVLYKDQGQYL
ncbi:MAG TPA: hypothetical protein DDY13_03325 [Cytophagales bacterium]|nr:hypothetical protein [Cytophagales bacterium]